MTTLTSTQFARTLAKKAVVIALAVPVLLPGLAYADSPTPPNVPSTIAVPAGNVPFLLGHATGTQNYACRLGTTGGGGLLVAAIPSQACSAHARISCSSRLPAGNSMPLSTRSASASE